MARHAASDAAGHRNVGVKRANGISGRGLVISTIKRDVGIKRWGDMIQSHDGILDLVDSFVLSAPFFINLTGQ